jgi:hypothetical protein
MAATDSYAAYEEEFQQIKESVISKLGADAVQQRGGAWFRCPLDASEALETDQRRSYRATEGYSAADLHGTRGDGRDCALRPPGSASAV